MKLRTKRPFMVQNTHFNQYVTTTIIQNVNARLDKKLYDQAALREILVQITLFFNLFITQNFAVNQCMKITLVHDC